MEPKLPEEVQVGLGGVNGKHLIGRERNREREGEREREIQREREKDR